MSLSEVSLCIIKHFSERKIFNGTRMVNDKKQVSFSVNFAACFEKKNSTLIKMKANILLFYHFLQILSNLIRKERKKKKRKFLIKFN